MIQKSSNASLSHSQESSSKKIKNEATEVSVFSFIVLTWLVRNPESYPACRKNVKVLQFSSGTCRITETRNADSLGKKLMKRKKT